MQRALERARAAGVDVGSEASQASAELGSTMVLAPQVFIRNPAIAEVNALLQPPVPSLGEIAQAVLVGETTDIRRAVRGLRDASDRALDEAIATAQQQGAEVSRDDYVFTNYDPTQDYGPEDYEALVRK